MLESIKAFAEASMKHPDRKWIVFWVLLGVSVIAGLLVIAANGPYYDVAPTPPQEDSIERFEVVQHFNQDYMTLYVVTDTQAGTETVVVRTMSGVASWPVEED